jgi:parallel beta-helix repeat protein
MKTLLSLFLPTLINIWRRGNFFVVCLLVLVPMNNLAQPLSGTYIIGTGETYTSITDAVNAVSNYGISGKVTFKIKDGIYNEPLDIAGWKFGNDSIIFEGNSSDSTAVKVFYDAQTAENFVLRIKDSKNILFRYIHFKAEDADSARVVLLSDGAHHIAFEHCVFENACSNCTSEDQTLVTALPVHSISGGSDTLGVCDSLTLRHSLFRGGYKALRLGGCYNNDLAYPYQNIFKYAQGNVVDSNVFENFSHTGIELIAARRCQIEANRLISNQANVTGIIQKMSSVNAIKRNYVLLQNNGSGIVAEDYYGTAGEFLDIWNNVILIYGPAIQPKGVYYGILLENKNTVSARVYHNTVSIYSSRVDAAMAIKSTTGVEIKQNIFAHYRKGYFISIDSYSYGYDIDNNNYYSNRPDSIAFFDGAELNDTSEVSSYGLDNHPVFVLPILHSTNDPTPLNCQLDNKGQTSLINTDFYGNPRNPSSPDLGAVEFTPNSIQGGTYTVGQNGDFSTLGDALHVLSSCASLTGPLTLLLTDATYVDDPISVDSLGSSDYPILIKPASGVSPTITIRDSSSFDHGIDLKDVQNLIIDGSNNGSNSRNLTLIVEGNNTSSAVNIAGYNRSVKNVEIKNCNVKFLMAGNPEVDEGVLNFRGYQEIKNVTIRNNTISGGRLGIYIPGSKQMVIEENTLVGVQKKGIAVVDAWDVKIAKNAIRNILGNTGDESAGIYLSNSSTVTLERNLIDTVLQKGYIVSGIHVNAIDTAKNIIIRNNIIRHVAGTGTDSSIYWSPTDPTYFPSGIRLEFGGYFSSSNIIKVYHNTIELKAIDNNNRLVDNTTAVGILTTLAWGSAAPGIVDIRNNLIINSLGKYVGASGTRGMAVYFDQITPSFCSNNIYYSEGYDTLLIGIIKPGVSEQEFSSMYEWRQGMQSQLNLDDHSYAIKPEVDPTNLKPDANFAFANNTAVGGLVSEDFGGNPRDPQKPDIGAWEYNGNIPVVKGTITSDTTWTGNLAMVDTVVVSSGKTLTLAAGTNIQVADSLVVGYRIPLMVKGKLVANGTVNDTVQFVPATHSRWGGIRFETSTGGSSLSYLRMGADTLTGNNNRDTALVILNNPGITIEHLALDSNTYVAIKAVNSNITLKNSSFYPKFSSYYMHFKGGKAFVESSNFTLNPSGFIYNGLMHFEDVDSARIDSCQFTDNTISNVPELLANSGSGKIYFTRNRIQKYGEIKVRDNFTGTLWMDKNRYFHPKNILQHNSSRVIMTNNLIYSDSNDTNPFSIIYMDGNYAAQPLKLLFINNTWFRKGGTDGSNRISHLGSSADSLFIKNNIFYGLSNLYSNSGGSVIFDYNAYDPAAGTNHNIGTGGLAFRDTLSEASLDLAQRYTSTGINAGDPGLNMNLFPDTLDLAGKSRRFSDTLDLGAYEFIPLKITSHPSDVAICEGSNAMFSVGTNFTPDSYQWQTSSDSVNWTNVGFNQDNYSISNASVSGGDTTITYIRCIVSADGFANDTSNTAVLTVYPKLNVGVTISADDTVVCEGTQVTFTATPDNGGGSPAYRWFVNNVEQTGETSSTFSYTPSNNDTVRCELTSSEGCVNNPVVNSNSITVEVLPSPCRASFSLNIDDTTGRKVSFTNNSEAASVHYWRFGDGTTSNAVTPSPHTYPAYGNYKVCLTVYNASLGCVSDTCQVLSLYPNVSGQAVRSAYTYAADSINPLLIRFTNQSSNASRYYWTFGDGSFSTASHPDHTYQQSGLYNVCLVADNTVNGSKDEFCQPVVVGTPYCMLQANFSFVVDSANVARFFNTSSGNYQQVYWNFADGSVSSVTHPVHTYAGAGAYPVTLTMVDTVTGCSSTQERLVEVGVVPCSADFEYFVDAPNRTMWLASRSTGNISEYLWQLDQGAVLSGPSGNITVPSSGMYTVTLSIYSDSSQCSDQTSRKIQMDSVSCNAAFHYLVDSLVQKTYFFSGQLAPGTRRYWLFGDGSFSTLPNPVHQYAQPGLYTVSLTIYNPATQCMDYVEQLVYIGGLGSDCEANFAYFPQSSNPLQIRFRNRSQGNIVRYLWNFGDGTLAYTPNPLHTFNSAGTYNVCLSVTNSNGISNMSCRTIRVGANANDLPKADFVYQIDPEALTATFQNTSSGNYTLSFWYFGDGNSATEAHPVHTYAQAGLYLVSLRVVNGTNYSYRYKLLNVGLPDTFAVQFAYLVNPYSKKAGGYPVDFIGAGLGDEARLKWNFGDGATDTTSTSPTHVYQDAGDYQVCLTLTDPITGQQATSCQTVSASELCQADTIKPTALCKSISVFLNASGVADITPLDVDNGSSDACGIASRTLSQSHFTLSNLGSNNVTLTVADAKGNTSSCTAVVNVQKGTDIESIAAVDLKVYPNPFAQNLYVQVLLKQSDELEITLTDLTGRRIAVLEKAYQQESEKLYLIDMRNISKGSYILQVKTAGGQIKQRVVIKN